MAWDPNLENDSQSHRRADSNCVTTNKESQSDSLATTQEQFSAALATIPTIPESMKLASFPAHWEGPDCWCRPHVDCRPGEMVVRHRDLHNGEFDS